MLNGELKIKHMKISFKSFSFGLLVTISLIGCNKNDNKSPDTSVNILKYNKIEYPTPNGMLVFDNLINNGLCQYDLKIYSSNFTFNSTTGEITGINGTGQIITFYAISSIHLTDVNADGIINANDIVLNNLVLDEGEYSFSTNFTGKTFEADFTTTANNSSDSKVHSIESGTLSITKSGDIYEITYIGLDENGINISGYYKGKLNVLRNR